MAENHKLCMWSTKGKSTTCRVKFKLYLPKRVAIEDQKTHSCILDSLPGDKHFKTFNKLGVSSRPVEGLTTLLKLGLTFIKNSNAQTTDSEAKMQRQLEFFVNTFVPNTIY